MWIYRLESWAVIFAMSSAGLFFVGIGFGWLRFVTTTKEMPDGRIVTQYYIRFLPARRLGGEIDG